MAVKPQNGKRYRITQSRGRVITGIVRVFDQDGETRYEVAGTAVNSGVNERGQKVSDTREGTYGFTLDDTVEAV